MAKCFQLLAMLVSLLAAISLGLGVANFIATYFLVFTPTGPYFCNSTLAGCTYSEAVVYSFIMPGVWGSLAVFVTGIMAIKVVSNIDRWRTIFSTVTFITSIIFVPAMIIISTVNAVKVAQPPGALIPSLYDPITNGYSNTAVVLFSLPIAVGGVGVIEFILTSGLLIYSCVCLKPKLPSREPEPESPAEPRKPAEPAEPVYPFPTAAYSPYGPLPYRRPAPYFGDAGPALYRPGVRSGYPFMPGRYPAAAGPGRPYPMSYMPPGY